MANLFLIIFGKLTSKLFRLFNLGNGSTWPGHIALSLNKNFIKQALKNSKTQIIIVAGTNGKTTTSFLIADVLKDNGKQVIQNLSGANLLNGIASSVILNSDAKGRLNSDFAIFETDENTLPQILDQCTPDYVILLNLFRDQLDRYGEVNIIASNWIGAISKLSDRTILILNADDPQIAFFGKNTNAKKLFFGLTEAHESEQSSNQSSDSDHCPKCGGKLHYSQRVFSHLGAWLCKKCGLKRPDLDISKLSLFPLPGTYNKYNSLSSALVLKKIGINDKEIEKSFSEFIPAFGRQEMVKYKGKFVQIFLSKNPTSFNESFHTISNLGARTLLIVLNDRIPDGRDVSWIWDTDLDEINMFKNVIVSGDRCYDMALRLKYEDYKNFQTFEDLDEAINKGIDSVKDSETFFILPTYSAMLDARKILTGKKIL